MKLREKEKQTLHIMRRRRWQKIMRQKGNVKSRYDENIFLNKMKEILPTACSVSLSQTSSPILSAPTQEPSAIGYTKSKAFANSPKAEKHGR